jgi:anti-sigma factor RsiW
MDWETQLKLQAYLDGELPETERGAMADKVAQGSEEAALLAELRQTREFLAGSEQGIHMPESREFFWSKIEREIQRQERPAPAPAGVSWLARLRWLLVPAAAVALLLVAGLVATRYDGSSGLTDGAEIETAQADTKAFTYRDYEAGMTLVWLSYPADREFASNEEIGIIQ